MLELIRIKRKNIVDIIGYLLILIFTTIYCASIDYSQSNFIVIFQYYIIGILSFVTYFFLNKRMTFLKIISVFNYIFFFIAPLQQYTDSKILWPNQEYSFHDYFFGNNIIILFMLLMVIAYVFTKDNKSKIVQEKNISRMMRIY